MEKHIKAWLFSALFISSSAMAKDVELIKVETSDPNTPLYQNEEGMDTLQVKGLMQASTSTKKWFRIAAEYSTSLEWTDRLTLEYYVLFPDSTNVYKGVVSYVDIPEGREHLSEMYMHFNSYARHYKRGLIQYAVVALIDGKTVAVNTNKRKPEEWWKTMPVHTCGLLDRSMTPFVVFNVEKFEAQERCSLQ